MKSHHRSFYLPTSIGVTGTKALLILERLFWSKTQVNDTGKNLTMTLSSLGNKESESTAHFGPIYF